MPLIKLKLFQVTACYRIPQHDKIHLTYDLPPYSNVLGFVMNLIGIKDGNDSRVEKYKNMKISIQGYHEGKSSNINTLLRCKKSDKKGAKDTATKTIYEVEEVKNITTIVHIDTLGDMNLFKDILIGLNNINKKIFLGRNGDLVDILEVSIVNTKEVDMEQYAEDNNEEYTLDNNIYIPRELCTENCTGITIPLKKTYTLRNGYRNWDKSIMTKLVQKGTILDEGIFLLDDDNDLVVSV